MVAVVKETVLLNTEDDNDEEEYHLSVLDPATVAVKLATVALFTEQKLWALVTVGATGVATTFTTTAARTLSQAPSDCAT